MTSENTLSQNHSSQPKEKVDKTFLDVNFFNDEKIQFLIREFGPAGVTYYLRIICGIFSERGSLNIRIAKSALKELCRDDAIVTQFLETCLEIGLVYIHEDGNTYGSRRADKEIQSLQVKRDQWRGRQSKHRKPIDCSVTPERVTRDTPVTQRDSEEEEEAEHEKDLEIEKDREQEKKRKKKLWPPPGIEVVPGVFLTDEQKNRIKVAVPQPLERKYWLDELRDYAETNPVKWKRYRDHERVLMKWRRRHYENGYTWSGTLNRYEKKNPFKPGDDLRPKPPEFIPDVEPSREATEEEKERNKEMLRAAFPNIRGVI